MASFDIITVVGLAYRKVWSEIGYLVPMAAIPFLMKLACFTALSTFITSDSLWVTSIVLLPAFFFEGWLLSHWARTVMTGTHRWPFRPSGNESKDLAELRSRGHGVMAGTVSYVLINFLIAGYYAFLLPYFPEGMDPQNADPRFAVVGLVMMVTTLLLFRFLWIYIPLSANLSLGEILKKIEPIRLTFHMIGVWLICVVPAFLALQLLGQAMIDVSGQAEGNAFIETIFLTFRIVIDMVKNIICTAGMAYVFLALFKMENKEGGV